MIWPRPFGYPTEPHQRRHGPIGYTNYQEYKPWLRDEFIFRCVYCLEREVWYPSGADAFSVDHVVPKCRAPGLVCEYANLVYTCVRCNSLRGEADVADPTKTAFGDHIAVDDDGCIRGLSARGKCIIDQLHLDCQSVTKTRRFYLRILRLKQRWPEDPEVHEFFLRAFAYPTDLPDLTAKRPPGGNSREEGTHACFHACQRRGELCCTY